MQPNSDIIKQQIMQYADATCPPGCDAEAWHNTILGTMNNSSETELVEILEEWKEEQGKQ